MRADAAYVDRCFEVCPEGKRRRRFPMHPVRLWFGLVFVAMGVLAILDAAEVVPWSQTFEGWWPIAVVGWGLADMLADREVTLGGAIIVAIGVTLLADEQAWAAEALVWSTLFLLVGAAILLPGLPTRRRTGSTASPGANA